MPKCTGYHQVTKRSADPFSGVATTGVCAKKLGRQYIGIEISETYHKLAIKRITNTPARMI